MPDGTVHQGVGVLCGVGAAWAVSADQVPVVRLLRAAAGALGGLHGGQMPDLLEPAISPLHRAIAHDALTLFGGGSIVVVKGRAQLDTMNARIRELEMVLEGAAGLQRFVVALAIVLGHLLVGYLTGFAAGYASHLVLDACTPRSLPMLGL
jgi:hypothetical protein